MRRNTPETYRACVESVNHLTKDAEGLVDCRRLSHTGRVVAGELDGEVG